MTGVQYFCSRQRTLSDHTTRSFSFFSQRTRLKCGMTHNVCVNNATPTRRYQHSMSPGAEGLSEHFTFGLAAISRPPMQMCERRCLRCYAFVPRDVIHAHSAGCTDRLSKATDPLSSHSLQKLLLFCSPTWTRGMTHNVSPHNATARRRIINSQWPRGGGPLSALYFEGVPDECTSLCGLLCVRAARCDDRTP